MSTQYLIYHNPRCSKSRTGLAYLKTKTANYVVVEYLKRPLTADKIRKLVQKTGNPAFDLVRTHEKTYKEVYKNQSISDDQWPEILEKHPDLIKRPIVESDNLALWAVPAEKIDELF